MRGRRSQVPDLTGPAGSRAAGGIVISRLLLIRYVGLGHTKGSISRRDRSPGYLENKRRDKTFEVSLQAGARARCTSNSRARSITLRSGPGFALDDHRSNQLRGAVFPRRAAPTHQRPEVGPLLVQCYNLACPLCESRNCLRKSNVASRCLRRTGRLAPRPQSPEDASGLARAFTRRLV